MACRPRSYTIVIFPLRTSLFSLDALRFYLWIKHLKNLEQEKDALYSGLEVLEEARLWYLQRLEENCARQFGVLNRTIPAAQFSSSQLRSLIQRVNGSLGSVMSDSSCTSNLCVTDTEEDSDLRWRNSVLTKEVGRQNRQISMLESEKESLQEELDHLSSL
ncbi:suppressor APC domain-containing protein 1 [Synchiropus splendidus]|uniref:suppressor APC domain-containing protein 1 n=1 Tax=Synchiropus splendidus TaxID=270530 RepID=UPI00237ED689|nr:suppressor APC domain-containing protein 1 [Synchiropus splendidus]